MSMALINPISGKQIQQKQVDQILQLQELFHSRFLTVDLLNQLISTYVEAIECFDGNYSPMRKYFLNKIQFILSRPEIDTMLKRNSQGDNVMDMLRETIRMTTGDANIQNGFSKEMLMEALEAENKKNKKIHNNNINTNSNKQSKQKTSTTSKNSSSTKPTLNENLSPQQQKFKDRHNKIQMQLKVMRQIQQSMKNISEQVQQEDQKFTKKNKRINALMEQQSNTLEARLAMRRKGKKQKKSGDQKKIKEIQEELPIIKKQELKQAQKQIEEAVVRMTLRMSQRLSNLGNKGVNGLFVSTNNTTNTLNGGRNTNGGNTAQRLQQQKVRGRIKIRNQVKQQDQQQDEDLMALDLKTKLKKKDNPQKQKQMQKSKPQQKMVQKQKKYADLPANYQSRNSQTVGTGTGRLTSGNQTGGRGRIKRKETKKIQQQDDEQII